MLSTNLLSRGKKLAALVFLLLTLLIPNRISAITPNSFANFPLEVLLVALSLLIPSQTGIAFRSLIAFLLGLGIIFKIADMATYQFFDRPFNPVLDGNFLPNGINFLEGLTGQMGAYLAISLLVALLIGIFVLVYIALEQVRALLQLSAKTNGLGLLAGLVIWTVCAVAGWQKASTPFYQLLSMHVTNTLNSYADLNSFNGIVDSDPYAEVPDNTLLAKLKGKDVLVVFIESYGRTVLDKADFSEYIRPLLEKSSETLASAGLFARSAYLTSPTYGGISWLAHGTLLSGLWINSQTRYDRLVMSERPSLNRLFKRAGWRTVAVQPAHTMDWPQGQYFGYDKIYAAPDLGYQGQPFNWITMPDQYTLSAFQSRERPEPHTPVMAEIALISSHAPWTPLPMPVDWQQVGDGALFNSQNRVGDTPEVVWQNTERIREQYRKSIEYTLSTLVSYATHYADEKLVILVLGDHQPAPFVTGESESHDVLVHLISRDSKIMEAVRDWQWTDGMLPADNAPVWAMDKVRDRFISTFSK
ncbi:sulfatase-like hydrolase/transferase [Methylomonas sp. AM2-LC]|uniref:sulfatase-like hydrolase/transferase n=1 Tax=Methylomonas sp. AM2-LC TaxID=3153301 RepID=UPI0032635460